ncbi:putative eIF-2-alpha [Planoprotostelium fungivorum]|uniref:Putative eIF-2-alpha n=1 Tax=Planoprotostelium fungivorum TaxID=1890364 RepID=A0A2P6NW23_9EUKA|nr:putative eIF-2-alpha [Planoprotostelium fungivorum]
MSESDEDTRVRFEESNSFAVQPENDTSDETVIQPFRFYENEFPEVNEIVMVKIQELNDFCAFVHLLEYNRPASIQFTEISNRRLRSTPSSLLKIGKQDVMQVLRVDEEKGYIDLTKKNVDAKEIAECTRKYNKSKSVHSTLSNVIMNLQKQEKTIEIEDLYSNLIWPIYRSEKYEHPLEAFDAALSDASVLDEFEIEDEVKKLLLKDISHHFNRKQVKVQATVEVTCFAYDGIDAIIPSLLAGRKVGEEKGSEVKITLISTPQYSLTTTARDAGAGIAILHASIQAITEEITKRKGNCKVAVEPSEAKV